MNTEKIVQYILRRLSEWGVSHISINEIYKIANIVNRGYIQSDDPEDLEQIFDKFHKLMLKFKILHALKILHILLIESEEDFKRDVKIWEYVYRKKACVRRVSRLLASFVQNPILRYSIPAGVIGPTNQELSTKRVENILSNNFIKNIANLKNFADTTRKLRIYGGCANELVRCAG